MTDTKDLRELAAIVIGVQPDIPTRNRLHDALMQSAKDLDVERARVESLSETVRQQAEELRSLRKLRDLAMQAESTLQQGLSQVKS